MIFFSVILFLLSIILDALLFTFGEWPYGSGGGNEYIFIADSLFFEQYVSHCLYFVPKYPYEIIILPIIPIVTVTTLIYSSMTVQHNIDQTSGKLLHSLGYSSINFHNMIIVTISVLQTLLFVVMDALVALTENLDIDSILINSLAHVVLTLIPMIVIYKLANSITNIKRIWFLLPILFLIVLWWFYNSLFALGRGCV